MAGEMTPEDLAIEDRSDQRDPDNMIRYRMVTLERKDEDRYAGTRLRRYELAVGDGPVPIDNPV